MGSPGEQADRIEALRDALDRLCAADLTLEEAKALRPNLSSLIDAMTTEARSVRGGTPRPLRSALER